jgi:hypothetical protein
MRTNGSLRIHASVLALALAACGGGGDGDDEGPLGGSHRVEGDVIEFGTGAAITGTASISTSGLSPSPTITSQGASFTIDGVPENSTFHVLASVSGTHRATFSPAVTVGTDDLDGVEVFAVSESFLASLSAAFGVTPTAGKGVLFARIVDGAGAPRAGFDAAANLDPDGGPTIDGPYYLDAVAMPDATLTMTSGSGWVLYFEIDPGVAGMAPEATADVTVDMPISPINAGAVTVAHVAVTDGATPLPTNVSFAQQVLPIFELRGCVACHSGNGPGRDLGNLTLNGSSNLVYRELLEEFPTRRVNGGDPSASRVLTMPLLESPPDNHPNVTWTSPFDPDYRLILAWIIEGALEN